MGLNAAGEDDAQLMARYASGDSRAFEVLYTRHKTWLYRVLLRNLCDETLAQDVFQETWLTIVRTAHTYEPRAKFTTWLYGLARQRLIDALRKQSGQPESLSATFNQADEEALAAETVADPHAPDPEDHAAWRQFGDALARALTRLPKEQLEVFVLWVEADLSVEEIAAATGQDPEATKSRLRYARAKLRTHLQAFETMK